MEVSHDLNDGEQLDSRAFGEVSDPQPVADAALQARGEQAPAVALGHGRRVRAEDLDRGPLEALDLESDHLDVGREGGGRGPGRVRIGRGNTGGRGTRDGDPGLRAGRHEVGRQRSGGLLRRAGPMPADMMMRRVRPADSGEPGADRPFLPGRLIDFLLPSGVVGGYPLRGCEGIGSR